jgi:hypothetical protein
MRSESRDSRGCSSVTTRRGPKTGQIRPNLADLASQNRPNPPNRAIRVENDAGEVQKGKNRPNLPLFDPKYDHFAAVKRIRAKNPTNRAIQGFKPAKMPEYVLSPAEIGRIVTKGPETPPGWWAAPGAPRQDVQEAYSHRMHLLERQTLLRRRRDAGSES